MTQPRALKKPWWLPPADWTKLLEVHDGAPRCTECGTHDNLSVDHIHPRRHEGTDDLSNLQFLCVSHNSRKGPRPDQYWSRSFYWDLTPDLSKMRTAQRIAFESIVSDPVISEYFSRYTPDVARRIYLLAWVVGAGKTLGIPAVAFAYNHLIRREVGAVRRADRILILAKEQAIRDQLAADLRQDLTRYGITKHSPAVAVITRGDQLDQREWLDHHDAVVACVHQFWERNGEQRQGMAGVLDYFPLIFVDEPHWAPEQVRKIVGTAYRSLVFGLTGTPISAQGALFRDFVLLSSYSYQDAVDNDQSLKHLDESPARRSLFLHEVRMRSAEVMRAGRIRELDSIDDPDYDVHQLEPAQNVVEEVIRYLVACDGETTFGVPAEHRPPCAVADLVYKAHALIACQDVNLARRLCESTNAMLEANRRIYPRAAGWAAEVVHAETADLTDGHADRKGRSGKDARIAGQRLHDTHPWMRSKTLLDADAAAFGIDEKCARILFVVGMAREGVNNPLCAVVGATYAAESISGVVQRHIGRQLRAPVLWKDGVLHVPPARLDTVRVITHQANNASGAVVQAINFVCKMPDHLSNLPTIAEVAGGDGDKAKGREPGDDRLDLAERLSVAEFVAGQAGDQSWRDDDRVAEAIRQHASRVFSGGDARRAEMVAEWVDEIRREPETARARCRLDARLTDIAAVPAVVREDEQHEPDFEELEQFIRRHFPELAEFADPDNRAIVASFRAHYRTWADSIALPQVPNTVKIETVRRSIAASIERDLRAHIDKSRYKEARSAIHRSVGAAVRRLLCVPSGEEASNDSKYDTPQAHVVVLRHDNRRAIEGYVRAQMVRQGFCPGLARAFGIG